MNKHYEYSFKYASSLVSQSKFGQAIEIYKSLLKSENKEKDTTPLIQNFSKVLTNSSIKDQVKNHSFLISILSFVLIHLSKAKSNLFWFARNYPKQKQFTAGFGHFTANKWKRIKSHDKRTNERMKKRMILKTKRLLNLN